MSDQSSDDIGHSDEWRDLIEDGKEHGVELAIRERLVWILNQHLGDDERMPYQMRAEYIGLVEAYREFEPKSQKLIKSVSREHKAKNIVGFPRITGRYPVIAQNQSLNSEEARSEDGDCDV